MRTLLPLLAAAVLTATLVQPAAAADNPTWSPALSSGSGVGVAVQGGAARIDQRTAFRDDWRGGNDRWRYRDRGASFSVGVGISDPYYAYGYDDGYGAYAAAEPYAYGGYARRGYGDGYYSYGAASGCTCATPYASWNNTGWGGYRSGFAAW